MLTKRNPFIASTSTAVSVAAAVGDADGRLFSQRIDALERLRSHLVPLNAKEEKFAELFVLYRNKRMAYEEAYDCSHMPVQAIRNGAYAVSTRPQVLAYIRQLQATAAQATIIDVGAILEHDAAIVAGADHVDELIKRVWHCCRHCHGQDHAYQWIDENEFYAALAAAHDVNATRERPLPLPTEAGGFGFQPTEEPYALCPKCEGFGVQRTIIADTTKLRGPAAAIFRGLKETRHGVEVLLHDVDKAKDRLLRAAGVFNDDAAAVAKGAAAGAAAGASAAVIATTTAAAKQVDNLTADQAARLYLQLVG